MTGFDTLRSNLSLMSLSERQVELLDRGLDVAGHDHGSKDNEAVPLEDVRCASVQRLHELFEVEGPNDRVPAVVRSIVPRCPSSSSLLKTFYPIDENLHQLLSSQINIVLPVDIDHLRYTL